jgi:hypothetical protein
MGESLLEVDIEGTSSSYVSRPEIKIEQEFPSGTREEFIANCKAGQYDDVVALYRSNTSTKVDIVPIFQMSPSLTSYSTPVPSMQRWSPPCPSR